MRFEAVFGAQITFFTKFSYLQCLIKICHSQGCGDANDYGAGQTGFEAARGIGLGRDYKAVRNEIFVQID